MCTAPTNIVDVTLVASELYLLCEGWERMLQVSIIDSREREERSRCQGLEEDQGVKQTDDWWRGRVLVVVAVLTSGEEKKKRKRGERGGMGNMRGRWGCNGRWVLAMDGIWWICYGI